MNVDEAIIRRVEWCADDHGCEQFWEMIDSEPSVPASTLVEHLIDNAHRDGYMYFGGAFGITTKTGVNYRTLENLLRDIREASASPGPEGVATGPAG